MRNKIKKAITKYNNGTPSLADNFSDSGRILASNRLIANYIDKWFGSNYAIPFRIFKITVLEKVKKWKNAIFCKHSWYATKKVNLLSSSEDFDIVMEYKCIKCGKIRKNAS